MKEKFLYLKLPSVLSIALVLFGAIVPNAVAEEIIISGNGAGSDNQVAVGSTQQTTVTQSNTASITNNVTTNANTGNNTASNNTGGDTAIVTGNVTANTEVINSVNSSSVTLDPCNCAGTTQSTIISGNGANSQNTVNNTTVSQTNVAVNQSANITNNLTTNANTGNNTASNNSGNVTIKTGNIFASTSLINAPVNISKIKVFQGLTIDSLLKIAGNGVSSINTLNNVTISNVNVSENNIANFINNIVHSLNTGGNTASNNNGDVLIATGDIWSEIKVKNLANINEVIVDCGCKQKPGEETPPILPPGIITTPPSSSSSGGGGGGGNSSSSGGSSGIAAAIGNMLPSTGTNWLFLALFGNIMMLFLGAYLRLRSGRGPGLALAI